MPSFRLCAWGLALFIAAGAALSGCRTPVPSAAVIDETPETPWFQDVTQDVGLDFVHDAGPLPTDVAFLPQIIGSGAALFDFDNDGRLDIFLLQNAGPDSRATNRLYRQGADGRFTDVSRGSGLDVAGYGMGVAAGDVNNDGWVDLLVTEYGRLRLFLNNGNGTFREVSREAGLDSPLWGTSASFFDYDRDGWLDLIVVNYVDYDPTRKCDRATGKPDYCHPGNFHGTVAKLYRNLGKGEGGAVRFADVTLTAGLGGTPGSGLGVVCADFTGDGWPDIFVANDALANRLWVNQRNGTFVDEAVVRGVAYNGLGQTQGNMGIALGDTDGDGLLDLFVTHLTEETDTLWKQEPGGLFRDRTGAAGLAASRWRGTGFGTVLADFDHDGWPDIAVVNGRVARRKVPGPEARGAEVLGPYWGQYGERNQLFRNEGNGQFRDLSPGQVPFCGTANVARGLAVGDIDGDGAPDLLVTTVAGPAKLYRNVVPNRGHWLLVRALDPALKRDAYGARITARAGERRWVRWLNPGSSYLCSNDPRAHFGLGAATQVDALEVVWPDGTAETFPGGAADRAVVLRKGEGKRLGS